MATKPTTKRKRRGMQNFPNPFNLKTETVRGLSQRELTRTMKRIARLTGRCTKGKCGG